MSFTHKSILHLSSPEVGSSKIISFLLDKYAVINVSFCICPPESEKGCLFLRPHMSNSFNKGSISSYLELSIPYLSSPITEFVKNWNSDSCIIKRLFRYKSSYFIAFPLRYIFPCVGFNKPHKHFPNVVFPAPFCPIIQVISLELSLKDISLRILFLPYLKEMFLTSNTFS